MKTRIAIAAALAAILLPWAHLASAHATEGPVPSLPPDPHDPLIIVPCVDYYILTIRTGTFCHALP
jgi:hypothetical protein